MVSSSVEQAHGIGKRRDERKPPTMSQLMEIAHTVAQLLLEPYSAVLYQQNKGRLPAQMNEIKAKFGLLDDPKPEVEAEPEVEPEPEQPTQPPVEDRI